MLKVGDVVNVDPVTTTQQWYEKYYIGVDMLIVECDGPEHVLVRRLDGGQFNSPSAATTDGRRQMGFSTTYLKLNRFITASRKAILDA